MKIIKLEAENVKKLKAVEIKPDGSLVVIGGKNEAGKSSVLDAIAYALGGKRLCPKEPIRRGCDQAKVKVDLGELVVERTFTEKGTSLSVKRKDGFNASSPQAILDTLVGTLTFDPLAFLQMDPKRQVETLKAIIGLDFTAQDAKREQLYQERTLSGRDVQGRQSQLATMPEYSDTPKAEVSVVDLLAKLEWCEKHNDAKDTINAARDQAVLEVTEQEALVRGIGAQLVKGKEVLEHLRKELLEHEARVKDSLYENEDEIKDLIAAADETNRAGQANKAKADLEQHFAEAKENYDVLTKEIETIDMEKADALANATFPIEGLSFSADGVTLEDLPFEQASQGQQLRTSVAMGLAMNPTLRVMLIRDGSLLDQDNLKLLAEMATDKDAQIWIERVGTGPEVSVLIEDGAIASKKEENR